MKLIVENNNSNYKDRVLNIINKKKNEIYDFFDKSLDELPFNVYIYDSSESMVEGLKKRGFGEFPGYMDLCQVLGHAFLHKYKLSY